MSIIHHARPFNVKYAIWEQTGRYPDQLRTHRTAKASWLYINRQHGVDDVGPTPNWATRDDLVASGRCGPQRSLDPALDGLGLWTMTDELARRIRPDEPVLAHAVGSLPMHEGKETWRNLIVGFCEDFLTAQGMVVDWAIHQRDARDGAPEILPHVHMLITTRIYDRSRVTNGQIQQTWLRTPAACKRLAEKWYERSGIYPSAHAIAA